MTAVATPVFALEAARAAEGCRAERPPGLILRRRHGSVAPTAGISMRPRGPRTPESYQPRKPGQPGKTGWTRKPEHRRSPRGAEPRAGDGAVVLYGWHTVKAALENPARRIRRLFATENAARRLAEDGLALDVLAPDVETELVRPDAIAHRLGPDAVHNGVLAEADPLPSPELDELEPAGIVLVLDQITDPHNVGAILRTAAGFAVAAVVTTARHSPEATGVLAKSASGALEYVPIVTVQNLARALELLRERGYLLVGLDSTGDIDLSDAPLRAPLALVLGAEGKGLRQLTRATCDRVARLDLPGRIKSLNVSNAAALALYVASKRTT
jgi:23S rRNA (guanosine2251-2'-O)-methyltransferase